MSTGSLFSSLFRDNSFASRSSSMFHKTFMKQQTPQQRPRSHSTYMDKNPNSNVSNKYLPVARMTHMLAVKIKKLNYFLFCRLQANLKKCRAESPKKSHDISNQIATVQSLCLQSQIKSNNQNTNKGIQILCQFYELAELKYQNTKKLQQSFRSIRRHSKKNEASQKIYNTISENLSSKTRQSFRSLCNNEKFILKSQIFTQILTNALKPKIRNVFKQIRQYAILSKIQAEMLQRQKKSVIASQSMSISDLDITQHITLLKQRLKSIEQESSSILSEEQTARFVTPEKQRQNSRDKNLIHIEQERQKTSRRDTKNISLNRKQTKKQCQIEQQLVLCSHSKSNRRTTELEERLKYSAQKITTKIQPHKLKIMLPKACQIITVLSDKKIIKLSQYQKQQEKECMFKLNRLHSQSIPNMIPDLHDNIGVFQNNWMEQVNTLSQQIAYSHRTIERYRHHNVQIQNNKTLNFCKQKHFNEHFHSQIQNQAYEKHSSQAGVSHNQKQLMTQKGTTISSRTITNSMSSPKFGIQLATSLGIPIQTSNLRQVRMSTNNSANQFYSSPLYKIQQMMIDLQKLRQKEKFNSKYSNNVQKCKISVNLPKKSFEGRSYQGSANKTSNNTSSQKHIANECRSQKRQLKRELAKRLSCKQNKEHKQNIEVKLWDQKQKFLFYAQAKQKNIKQKQRKRSSCVISSVNQTQLNTARKMKKQIQNIINNRKNRTSLGNLKLMKTKY